MSSYASIIHHPIPSTNNILIQAWLFKWSQFVDNIDGAIDWLNRHYDNETKIEPCKWHFGYVVGCHQGLIDITPTFVRKALVCESIDDESVAKRLRV